jgi:hypothetical protein
VQHNLIACRYRALAQLGRWSPAAGLPGLEYVFNNGVAICLVDNALAEDVGGCELGVDFIGFDQPDFVGVG